MVKVAGRGSVRSDMGSFLPFSTTVYGSDTYLGCRVSGFGFRVWDFGFRVSGLGFRVSGWG